MPAPSIRSRRLLGVALPLSLLLTGGALAAPAPAAAATSTYLGVTTTSRVSGLPQPFTFVLQMSGTAGAPMDLSLSLARRTRNAGAAEIWIVEQASLSCTARLSRCTIGTGSVMGAFGRVRLTFRSSGPMKVDRVGCPGDPGTLASVYKSRPGILRGSIVLHTGMAFFGTIRNRASAAHRIPVALPALMTRTTATNACAASSVCLPVYMIQPVGPWVLATRRSGPHGAGGITAIWAEQTGEPHVVIERYVTVSGKGPSLLSIANDPDPLVGATATVPKNPFLSGTLTFESHAPLVDTKIGSCAARSRDGSLSSSLKATLPGLPAMDVSVTAGHLVQILP